MVSGGFPPQGGTKIDDSPVDGVSHRGISSNWAYDHAADLDAHTKNIFEELRTGGYPQPSPIFSVPATALTANRLYGTYHIIARDLTVDRITAYITGAGAGGTKARMGIYRVGNNLAPGELVLDAGEVAVDSAPAGLKISIDQALTKGIYYTAINSDGTPTFRFISSTTNGIGNAYYYAVSGWYAAQTYGALPDPFPSSGLTKGQTTPLVQVRIKTLD